MTTESRLRKIVQMNDVTAEEKVAAFIRILVDGHDDDRVLFEIEQRSYDVFSARMDAEMAEDKRSMEEQKRYMEDMEDMEDMEAYASDP